MNPIGLFTSCNVTLLRILGAVSIFFVLATNTACSPNPDTAHHQDSVASEAESAVKPTSSAKPEASISAEAALADSVAAQWQAMNTSDAKQAGRELFRENKYGMFIHWGLYSGLGGVWKGEKMEDGGRGPAVAEWIMRRKDIPRAEYAKLADTFNPVNFDADEWVAIAKAAGMRYMVITSKHHDGFALFDSDISDFNSVDGSPFGRDIIKELEEACKKAGISFGVYYSHAVDWMDGGDAGYKDYVTDPPGRTNMANIWDPAPVSFEDYIYNKALPQVKELLANYELTQIWFDYPAYIPARHSFDFYRTVYDADPSILVNERIGNDFGDIGIPGDNIIPDEASEAIWEGIATTNHSWGYKSYDDDWKSPTETLFWLIENVSKGGNFLLNVGPDGSGTIPAESVENLLAVGKWLKVNGDAIYGTTPWKLSHEGPTKIAMKGTAQVKNAKNSFEFETSDFWFTQKNDKLYVIALARPENAIATIQALKGLPIKSIKVLGESGEVSWSDTASGLAVTLPAIQNPGIGYALEVTLK